jgi:hypothetical protein
VSSELNEELAAAGERFIEGLREVGRAIVGLVEPLHLATVATSALVELLDTSDPEAASTASDILDHLTDDQRLTVAGAALTLAHLSTAPR